jgi:membrane carboxypeptidase/penicillin-binding protein
MNRGFAAVVAVPAWADFMKQATAGDGADWFQAPPDVEKVAICRTSGLLATDACRTKWAGLPTPSTVYEDYFQIGSAPTEPCQAHSLQLPSEVTTESTLTTSSLPAAADNIERVVAADGHVTWVIRR